MEISVPIVAGDNDSGDVIPGRYGASRRPRAVALVLSAGMVGLILLALLSMAALQDVGRAGGTILNAITLSPPPGEKSPNPTTAHQAAKAATTPHETPAPAAPKLPPRVQINNPDKVEWPEGFIHLAHGDLASADIGKIHSAPAQGTGDTTAGGGGKGGGEGPGGSQLYNAQWYREPRDAEIQGYMRPGQSTGRWAEIACRTIDGFHVEDCRELDEEPRGSGMARVLREAAWQFLVRPPRVDGKPLTGTWVRIHFDFTRNKASESDG